MPMKESWEKMLSEDEVVCSEYTVWRYAHDLKAQRRSAGTARPK